MNNIFNSFSFGDISLWTATVLASIVGLLTLHNAAKLKTGILAIATYSFGAGMFCLAGTLLIKIFLKDQITNPQIDVLMNALFIVGFAFMGYGSYRIYQMSKI